MTVITEPGVYVGMPDAVYHGDPVPGGSLSSTGARAILDSPARYRWLRDHPIVTHPFDVGHAVHSRVLGTGPQPVEIPEDVLSASGSTNTAAAREFIAGARTAGQVPLKGDVFAEVTAMCEAVLAHPIARALLERPGSSEASVFGIDPDTGVWLRTRPDHLPDPGPTRTLVTDLKTARDANPSRFGRVAWTHHYEQQAALYLDALTLVRGDEDPAFLHVLVEKQPPWLVAVVELDADALRVGRARNRAAIDTYASCTATGQWPGYPPTVHHASLPGWTAYEETA